MWQVQWKAKGKNGYKVTFQNISEKYASFLLKYSFCWVSTDFIYSLGNLTSFICTRHLLKSLLLLYKSGDLNSSRAIFCSYLKCYAQSKHVSHVCLFGVIYEHPNTVSEKKPKNNLNSKKHKCNLLGFKTLWDKSNNINPPPAFAFWLLRDYQPACMRTAPEKMRGGEAVPLLTDLTTLLCVCECLQKRFRGYFNS